MSTYKFLKRVILDSEWPGFRFYVLYYSKSDNDESVCELIYLFKFIYTY